MNNKGITFGAANAASLDAQNAMGAESNVATI